MAENPRPTQRFQETSRRILEDRWSHYPTAAAKLGLHQYDGMLPDLSAPAIRARLLQIGTGLTDLASIDPGHLSAQDRMDYKLLELALQKERHDLADLRILERDPMRHLGYLNVTNYIQRDYAPLPDRVRPLTQLLSQATDFLDTALSGLNRELGRPVLEMSIEAYEGMARFYRSDLQDWADKNVEGGLRGPLNQAREKAYGAIGQFVAALRELLPHASPEFAIGPQLYADMLKYGEGVDLPLSQVEEVGRADLDRNRRLLAEAAARSDPATPAEELVKAIGLDHPAAADLIPESRRLLESIRGYIADHDLIGLPSEERCLVTETPPFMRWAFAAMDAPGPLENRPGDSFYYVTPVEDHWPDLQKEEWLSVFNYSTIQIIGIHEVYPGHFVHSLHSRAAPSLASKSLRAYSTSEGWAHYTEEMMLDEGYGGDDHSLRMSQVCEALLRDCRYICSLGMHTGGMSVDDASRFFMENAHMEEFPAHKEALRGTFDPGYLNYTLGKLMILKLREDYRSEQGSAYSLRGFHDRLLSYGAPPVPLLREVMLAHPGTEVL